MGPSHLSNGYTGYFPGQSAQIKISWSYTSTWLGDGQLYLYSLYYTVSSKFFTTQLVMKIVITYAECLPFLYRNLILHIQVMLVKYRLILTDYKSNGARM